MSFILSCRIFSWSQIPLGNISCHQHRGSVSQSSTHVTKLTFNFVSLYFFNMYSLLFISEYQLLPKHVVCLSKLLPFNMLFHFSAIHYLSYLPLWIMIHLQKNLCWYSHQHSKSIITISCYILLSSLFWFLSAMTVSQTFLVFDDLDSFEEDWSSGL